MRGEYVLREEDMQYFQGERDIITYAPYKVGDRVIRCADCNSVILVELVNDRCPFCGSRPFHSTELIRQRASLVAATSHRSETRRKSHPGENQPRVRSLFGYGLRLLLCGSLPVLICRYYIPNELVAIGILSLLSVLFFFFSSESRERDRRHEGWKSMLEVALTPPGLLLLFRLLCGLVSGLWDLITNHFIAILLLLIFIGG